MRYVIKGCYGLGLALLIAVTFETDRSVLAQGTPNALLRGDYAFTFFRSCVVDAVGFTSDLERMSLGFSPITFAVAGTAHYNGDGTVTMTGQELGLRIDDNSIGSIPVFQADLNCTGTYTVSPDRTSTSQVFNCQVSVVAGSAGIGPTAFQHNGVPFKGSVTQSGLVLISNTSPTVETIATTGGATLASLICNRSGFAGKVR